MKIRKYIIDKDYYFISNWIQNEKVHYLWCAGRFEYPLKYENFNSVLDEHNRDYNDTAYMVTDNEDCPLGFFVCSVNKLDNSGFLKFILLNNKLRGNGIGTSMVKYISDYLSSDKKVSSLKLVVFDANKPARKCYEKAGFVLENEERNAFIFKDEMWGRLRMIKIL